MIITIKNLQQQTFTIDFDPEKTVLELKQHIFLKRGVEYIVEKQKLIYAGVILTDEQTISSYKVDEKKFIVVMLTRDVGGSGNTKIAKNNSEQQPDESAQQSTEISMDGPRETKDDISSYAEKGSKTCNQSNEIGGELEITEAASSTSALGQSSSSETRPISDYTTIDLVGELANASLQTRTESNLLLGEEYNRTVISMIEMGYAREQVERAMAASFNNPERAVEYLINGIPQEVNLFNSGDDEELTRASGLREPSENLPTELTRDPFEFLRSQPQFLQMRSLIYQNPHLLHAVLQQIGQTNPALLQLISENQDAFLNMLNQPFESEVGDNTNRPSQQSILADSRRTDSSVALSSALLTEPQRSSAGNENPSISIASEQHDVRRLSTDRNVHEENLTTIRLTPHDQDAIERLKALGFPETLVLQAYFACEKNEELAANFLLSSSFDD